MVSTFIQTTTKANRVVIFSKTYCPYCANAKKLFEQLGQSATVYELDTMDNGAEIQNELLSMTGQRTVPNIFIKGKHVGGFSEVDRLHQSGQLTTLLA